MKPMTRKEMLDEMNEFELAVLAVIENDEWAQAYYGDKLTNEQKKRFERVREIFLEERFVDFNT